MSFIIAFMVFIMLSELSHATELTIGLIPEQNVFKQMARYKPIGEYIEKKTGIKVRFTMLSRYGNIIKRFTEEGMDGAFWGSFTGAMAIRQLGVEPVARPLWLDHTSTYHGYVFVRKDSGIKKISDLKGKTIAFVDKATTAGYVFPLAYLKEQGIRNVDTYFRKYYFAGSHDAAVYAVLDKKVDAGCAKNTIYDMLARNDPRVKKDLIILAKSPDVPSNGLGIRKDLNAKVKKQLKDALLGMDIDSEGKKVLKQFGAIKFIETTEQDYTSVFDIAEKAGIDIKGYTYINK